MEDHQLLSPPRLKWHAWDQTATRIVFAVLIFMAGWEGATRFYHLPHLWQEEHQAQRVPSLAKQVVTLKRECE